MLSLDHFRERGVGQVGSSLLPSPMEESAPVSGHVWRYELLHH